MTHELEIEVFRAGDYAARGKWSEAELDALAADYDPALHESPVTLDHAQSGPAFGWVAGLRRNGDRLLARLIGVPEGFMALLREGAFKKRSVEIFREMAETKRVYLKAVSFLGAAAPAVKGLRDLVFADDAAAKEFAAGPGEYLAFDLGESARTFPTAGAEAFAELQAELRAAGRWQPRWDREGIAEFFSALAAIDDIAVSEAASLAPAEWFAEFLRGLPAFLPLGEAAPPAAAAANASVPAGANVSGASIQLHRRVLAMRDARPKLSYAEALRECAAGF